METKSQLGIAISFTNLNLITNLKLKSMRKLIKLSVGLLAIASLGILTSCSDDDETEFKLVSLTSGTVDLNGATGAVDIPTDAVITATFSKEVDETSLNIALTQMYDNANIDVAVTVNKKVVTITPAGLGGGITYAIYFNTVKATSNDVLVPFNRSFTTVGTFVPAGQIAHWGFEDNANDDIGTYNASANGIVDITYASSRSTAAGKAASFNGTTSIIEVPNADELINTHDFTISFWVKTNSADITHGHFVLGLGAFYGIQFEINGSYKEAKFAIQYEKEDGTTASEDMWFPSNATDLNTGGWKGWDYAKVLTDDQMIALLKDSWLQVIYTFNGADRQGILYYNGEKMKSFDFDLWPDDDAKRTVVGLKYGGVEPDVVNELAFGFIQSRAGTMWDAESWGGYDFPDASHFKGLLDDVRIFHKTLTAQEVDLMYKSEKP